MNITKTFEFCGYPNNFRQLKPKVLTFGFNCVILLFERSVMTMNNSYIANLLPLDISAIDQTVFLDELIDATAKLEVYKEKIRDSKLDSSWFLPTLQQAEALSSSKLEGTQATIDGVLINQVVPNEKDQNLNEVRNYYIATVNGYDYLKRHDFSDEFFYKMHETLMIGNVRKPSIIGDYRKNQNYIGKNNPEHSIAFVPPAPEDVPDLMKNLIDYINKPTDNFRPLVRIAIIHAQFETIHPFTDGNGRVGRMLIPMYLFFQKQIELPCFFISEALEKDKMRYYTLLNDTRYKNDWNSWIKFFLSTVASQCDKYIGIIGQINSLYEKHLETAKTLARSSNIVDIINSLFANPVTTAKTIAEQTKLPLTSINRYLNMLVENKILFTNNKARNRTYFYYDLLEILR